MATAPFDLIEEAKRLIRFNTVTWNSNADCAVYVGSLLRKIGTQVSYQDSRVEGVPFFNVIGLIGHGKHPLLLTTHLDTVDPGDPRLWTKTGGDPWNLKVRGDTLTGLGAADTKLDILCKMLALAGFKPGSFKRPVILAGTFGEESGLRGAARFCQGELPKPEMALVGEPSEMALVARHKGLGVAEVLFKSRGLHRPTSSEWVYEATFRGQAAHSSTPDLGVNALKESWEFLRMISKRHPKVAVLGWEGGTGHNVIPSSATLRFSLGDLPKQSFRSTGKQRVKAQRLEPGWYPTLPWAQALWCIDTLQDLFIPLQKAQDRAFRPPLLTWNITWLSSTREGWRLTFDVRPLPGHPIQRAIRGLEQKLWKRWGHPGEIWQFRLERDNPPLDQERSSPVVRKAAAALKAARIPVKVVAKAGCSEAGLYARMGIPSVVIGPGRATGNIHQPNESISVKQLKKGIRFYQEFLKRTCF